MLIICSDMSTLDLKRWVKIKCATGYADISVIKRSKHNAHNVVFELLECCEKERERERYREATKEVCRLLQD